MSSLSDRWGVTANTVSRRLSRLEINPRRIGNYRYIKNTELLIADELNLHLSRGGTLDTFCSAHPSSFAVNPPQCSKISKSLRYAVLERDHYRCQACGATSATHKLEIDHIYPASLGGTSVLSNLRTLCQDCNRGKGSSIPIVAQNNLPAKQTPDSDGLTFSEWSKRHSLPKSTAYTIIRISGVKSKRLRMPHSRAPVAFFSSSQLQILDKVVDEYRGGKSLLSMEKEANESQQAPKEKRGSSVFSIDKTQSFLDQFMQLCALNAEEFGTPEQETVHEAFCELLGWYAQQNNLPFVVFAKNEN